MTRGMTSLNQLGYKLYSFKIKGETNTVNIWEKSLEAAKRHMRLEKYAPPRFQGTISRKILIESGKRNKWPKVNKSLVAAIAIPIAVGTGFYLYKRYKNRKIQRVREFKHNTPLR